MNNIRKYIDIVTESDNDSKIASHITIDGETPTIHIQKTFVLSLPKSQKNKINVFQTSIILDDENSMIFIFYFNKENIEKLVNNMYVIYTGDIDNNLTIDEKALDVRDTIEETLDIEQIKNFIASLDLGFSTIALDDLLHGGRDFVFENSAFAITLNPDDRLTREFRRAIRYKKIHG